MPPFLDPEMKNRICHFISGSNYFAYVLHEKRVYVHRVSGILQRKFPDIYARLYENSDYTNRTTLIDVLSPEHDEEDDDEEDENEDQTFFKDYAFICLSVAGDYNENRISFYLVSGEYNMSDDPSTSYIPGRFAFYQKESKTSVKLAGFALAEVPATSLYSPGVEVERVYLERRVGNRPGQFVLHSEILFETVIHTKYYMLRSGKSSRRSHMQVRRGSKTACLYSGNEFGVLRVGAEIRTQIQIRRYSLR